MKVGRTPKAKLQQKGRKSHIKQGTAAKPRKFPVHLAATPEEWRALKRQQWREVMAAIERYQWGAGYTPGQTELWHLGRLANQITEQLEPADWIAW